MSRAMTEREASRRRIDAAAHSVRGADARDHENGPRQLIRNEASHDGRFAASPESERQPRRTIAGQRPGERLSPPGSHAPRQDGEYQTGNQVIARDRMYGEAPRRVGRNPTGNHLMG